jgi:hypothetical protein
MAMNKQRRTANLNNIVTYDTLKNVTLLADLTIEGLTGAGFVKADANGLLSVDTGAYLPIPSQTGNSGKFLSTDGSVLSWQSVPQDVNIYNNDGTLTGNRTVTQNAYSLTFNSSTSATANNQVLSSFIIDPTFSVGAFTGTTRIGLQLQRGALYKKYYTDTTTENFYIGSGYELYGDLHASQSGYTLYFSGGANGSWQNAWNLVIGSKTDKIFNIQSGSVVINPSVTSNGGFIHGQLQSLSTSPNVGFKFIPSLGWNFVIRDASNTDVFKIANTSSNVIIGGTTDAGYKLDVQGTGRFTDTITGRTTDGTGLSLFSGAVTITALGGGRAINIVNGGINYTGGYNFFITGTSTTAALFSGDGLTTYLGNGAGYALQLIYNTVDTYTIKRGINAGHIPMYFDITSSDYTASAYGAIPSPHIRLYSGDNTGTGGGGYGNLILQHNGSVKRGNVLIGTSTNVASAILNISSTTQGFLAPRMTNAQRTAISTPATGLMAYSTDATEGMYLNLSGGWQRLLTTAETFVTSTGSSNYVPVFTSANTIGNSLIRQSVSDGAVLFETTLPAGIANFVINSPGACASVVSYKSDNTLHTMAGIDTGSNYRINMYNNGVFVGLGFYIPRATTRVILGNSVTDDGTNTLQVNGASHFKDVVKFSGNTSIPATAGTYTYLASGYSSPDSGRLFFGDGTGWKFHFSKRVSSTTTDLVTFKDDGNVGIGTTSPAAKLDVVGDILVPHTTTDSFIGMRFSGTYYNGFVLNGTTRSTGVVSRSGDATDYIWFGTNAATERVRITNDGNVGIGTVNPDARLRVSGVYNGTQAVFSNVDGRGLEIATSFVSGTNDAGSVLNARGAGAGTMIFQTESSERMRITSGGNLLVGTTNNTGDRLYVENTAYIGNTSGGLKLFGDGGSATIWTSIASPLRLGTNGSEHMRITSTGNVGIGVTNPVAKLQTSGAAQTSLPTLGSSTGAGLYITSTDTAYGMMFGNSPDGTGWIQQQRTDTLTNTYPISLQPSGGNVGIGNINPSQKLYVAGTSRFNHEYTHTSGGFQSGALSYAKTTTALSPVYTAGMLYGAWNSFYDNQFEGSATIPNSVIMSSQLNISRVEFINNNSTITFNQGSDGVRAFGNQVVQFQFLASGTSCSVSHVAAIQVLAPYYNGTNTPTISNYYGLLLNPSTEYSAWITVTKRWGLYQKGTNDNNYFQGKVIIGTNDTVGQSILNVKGLPTSSAGLSTGDVWNDAGTLKIV